MPRLLHHISVRYPKTGARMMRTPAQYRDDMSVTLYT